MLSKEIEELRVFIVKNVDQIKNVSVINPADQAVGFKCFIDHGEFEKVDEQKILDLVVPVTVTLTDAKENWIKVLQSAETLISLLRSDKAHKWNPQGIARNDSTEDYSLTITVNIPWFIG